MILYAVTTLTKGNRLVHMSLLLLRREDIPTHLQGDCLIIRNPDVCKFATLSIWLHDRRASEMHDFPPHYTCYVSN
ncbi:hypothetical protein Ancab_000892 [Ancistrocladus abbreviatus]